MAKQKKPVHRVQMIGEYPKVGLLTNSLFSSSIDAYFLK